MTDSWEDSWEDFDLGDLGDKESSQIPRGNAESGGTAGKETGLAWDDEEELSEEEAAYAVSAAVSKNQQAKMMKSRSNEAARIAAKHEASILANENPEERRLRERARVEETEQALAAELLGEQVIANVSVSGEKVAAGIEGMQVQTLQEHIELAMDVALKLRETSNGDHITAFLTELFSRLQRSITLSQLEDLIESMNKIGDAKRSSEVKKQANVEKQEMESRKRKDEKKKKNVHKDIFGGYYDNLENEYDEMAMDYADKYEEEFM